MRSLTIGLVKRRGSVGRVGLIFDKHTFHLKGAAEIDWGFKRAFCLRDLPKKNAPDLARTFFVQTEVRALFQHVQSVSKVRQKGRMGSDVHLA